MSCSCGGNDSGSAGSAGPILTGVLDPAYAGTAGDAGAAAPLRQAGVLSGFGNFSSGLFWVGVIVVIGIAWYAEHQKRKSQ